MSSRYLGSVKQHAQDVLVVDDGSTDETAEILRKSDGHSYRDPFNESGLWRRVDDPLSSFAQRGGYDILVTIDCDGQHEPQRIPEFVSACEDAADAQARSILSQGVVI